jgi:hypothetical protein
VILHIVVASTARTHARQLLQRHPLPFQDTATRGRDRFAQVFKL